MRWLSSFYEDLIWHATFLQPISSWMSKASAIFPLGSASCATSCALQQSYREPLGWRLNALGKTRELCCNAQLVAQLALPKGKIADAFDIHEEIGWRNVACHIKSS